MHSIQALSALFLVGSMLTGTAHAQSTTFYPASGQFGTLLFEDLWPAEGDYDFNDTVLRVNERREENASGLTTEITYNFNLYAMGARLCLGAAIRLPAAPGDVSARRMIGTGCEASGAAWAVENVNGVLDGAGGVVVPIATNLRQQLCGGRGGFLNTVPGEPTALCAPLALRVRFDPPLAAPPDAPGDVFIHRCDDLGHQVHRSLFYGVPGGGYAVDAARYLTAQDASEVDPTTKAADGTRFYVNTAGVPWAIALGDATYNIPAEGQRVEEVFPEILDFAQGTGGAAFWHTPVGQAFAFQDGGPPLPIAVFTDSPEEAACLADPIGQWTGASCSCAAGGPFFAWDGVACVEDLAAQCNADPYGTWDGAACVCSGTFTWSGTACFDASDAKATACVEGGTAPGGPYNGWYSQSFTGGGAWNGTTCDCSGVGTGYEWNGYGCYDPSGGQEQLCLAAGGQYDPWGSYNWSLLDDNQQCDCSAVGPGFTWDSMTSTCVEPQPGVAAACQTSGGVWLRGPQYCDCRALGFGWTFDSATQTCQMSLAESSCLDEGGVWTGSVCDCPDGQVWSGNPDEPWQSGTCDGGVEEVCVSAGGAWTGGTCACSPGSSWDSTLWQCVDDAWAFQNCDMAGGSWIGTTCDCSTSPNGWWWDGWSCTYPPPSYDACQMEGGAWVPVVPYQPYWHWSPDMGSCDCPAGELFMWGTTCVPYAEFECNWSAGWWDAMSNQCQCATANGGGPRNFGTWDGETCAPSLAVEICVMEHGSYWDEMNDTCMCDNSWGCPGCGGTTWGMWNAATLECESEGWDCQEQGGYWDPWSWTCDCTMNSGIPHATWDGTSCDYSGERHGCEVSGAYWSTWDPVTGMQVPEGTCDCYNYNGYMPMYPEEYLTWDPLRIECVDTHGRYTCEYESGGWWDSYSMSCDCSWVWDPATGEYNPGRWDQATLSCVPDAEVAACVDHPYAWWVSDPYGTYGMGFACECDDMMFQASYSDPYGQHHSVYEAFWSWDPQTDTGECTNEAVQGCETSGGTWETSYGYGYCDCQAVSPSYMLIYDSGDMQWRCGDPQQEACADQGGTWDSMYWTCDCSGPFEYWDGMSCMYSWEGEQCVASGGTWDSNSWNCDCSGVGSGMWNGSNCE